MYEVFEQLLKEYNVSPADVSRATGIGKSTFPVSLTFTNVH